MKIRTKTHELTLVYETKNNFMVDILVKNDTYEAWIYKKDMGVKELMFGIPKNSTCSLQMEELVEKNLEEYMIDYEMSYCYE